MSPEASQWNNLEVQQDQVQQQNPEAKSPEDIIALFAEMSYDKDTDFIDIYNQAGGKIDTLNEEKFFQKIDENNNELSQAEKEFQQAVETIQESQMKFDFMYKVMLGLQEKLDTRDRFVKKEVLDMSLDELLAAKNYVLLNREEIVKEKGVAFRDATINRLDSEQEIERFLGEIDTRLSAEFQWQYIDWINGQVQEKTLDKMSMKELKEELNFTQNNFQQIQTWAVVNDRFKSYNDIISYQKKIISTMWGEDILSNWYGVLEGKEYILQTTLDSGLYLKSKEHISQDMKAIIESAFVQPDILKRRMSLMDNKDLLVNYFKAEGVNIKKYVELFWTKATAIVLEKFPEIFSIDNMKALVSTQVQDIDISALSTVEMVTIIAESPELNKSILEDSELQTQLAGTVFIDTKSLEELQNKKIILSERVMKDIEANLIKGISETNIKKWELLMKNIASTNSEESIGTVLDLFEKHKKFLDISVLHPRMQSKYIWHPQVSIDTIENVKSIDYSEISGDDIVKLLHSFFSKENNDAEEVVLNKGEELVTLFLELVEQNPYALKELYNTKLNESYKTEIQKALSYYGVVNQFSDLWIEQAPDTIANEDSLFYGLQNEFATTFKEKGLLCFEYMTTKQLQDYLTKNPTYLEKNLLPAIFSHDDERNTAFGKEQALSLLINLKDLQTNLTIVQYLHKHPQHDIGASITLQQLYLQIVNTQEKYFPKKFQGTYETVLRHINGYMTLVSQAEVNKVTVNEAQQKDIFASIATDENKEAYKQVKKQLLKGIIYSKGEKNSISEKEVSDIVTKSLDKNFDTEILVKDIMMLPGSYELKRQIVQKVINNIAALQLDQAEEGDKKIQQIDTWKVVDQNLLYTNPETNKQQLSTSALYQKFTSYYEEECSKTTEWERQPTVEELFDSFLRENFKEEALTDREKKELYKTLVSRSKWNENKQKAKNIDAYIHYVQSWATGSFSSYVEKVESGEIELPVAWENIGEANNVLSSYSKTTLPWYSISVETMSLTTPTKTVTISEEEAKLLENNPEAQKNMVHFYNNLEKTGLESLWDNRVDILKGIASVKGTEFSYANGDYLSEKEMMTFFNAILVSVGEQPIAETTGMDDMVSIVTQKANRQAISGEVERNSYGRSILEQRFFDAYISWAEGTVVGLFAEQKFREAIS